MMNFNNINDTALVDVLANEAVPLRDAATKERTFTKGETQILNPMKPSVDQAKRDLQAAQAGLRACTDEFDLIKGAVNTGSADHKNELDKNMQEQEQIKTMLDEQAEAIEFYNAHCSQPVVATTKMNRKATRNANGEGWFKRNKGIIIPVLMILIIDLLGFICTLSVQREAFSVSVIVTRISCVLGICVISCFAHGLFNQIEAEKKFHRGIAGCCLGFILFLGLLTTIHSVLLAITASDTSEAIDFSLDLVERTTEMPASNSFNENIHQAIIMNPGVAEVLLACVLAVLSLLCAIPSLSKKSTSENNTTPEQQAANRNRMLDYYHQKAQYKQQNLTKKLNAKAAIAQEMTKNYESTMSGYKNRIPELSAEANEWGVKLIEAKTQLDYLMDEALQDMSDYRTLFCEFYREKNKMSTVAYEEVTKADLEKYFSIK